MLVLCQVLVFTHVYGFFCVSIWLRGPPGLRFKSKSIIFGAFFIRNAGCTIDAPRSQTGSCLHRLPRVFQFKLSQLSKKKLIGCLTQRIAKDRKLMFL